MNAPPMSPRKRGDIIVPVVLLTGAVGAGKTTALRALVEKLQVVGKNVRGIVAHRVMEKECVVGYDLEVIGQDARLPLARKEGAGSERIGPFVFSDEALLVGRRTLRESANAEVVVVDEFGPLELEGGGWAEEVKWLLRESNAVMVLVVRETLIERVCEWLQPYRRAIYSFTIEEFTGNELTKLISRESSGGEL